MIRLDGSKMSKSKGNLIAPEKYYETVGADGLRLFHLFVGPPADDVDWTSQTEDVIEGCARFLDRIYRLCQYDECHFHAERTPADEEVRRAVHRTIDKVTDGLEKWSYNTAVAALMELLNTISKAARSVEGINQAMLDESLDLLLRLLAPMAPHITAELWDQRHPNAPSVHAQTWPVADAALTAHARVTMVVQINGKVKSRVDVSPEVTEDEAIAAALADATISTLLAGATVQRVVAVPPRLINIIL
jgi:leucyl-tRNA synthetase